MQNKLFLILLLAIAGCTSNQTGNNQSLPDTDLLNNAVTYEIKPLIVDTADGWGGDIKLSLASVLKNDSGTIYKALSNYEGKTLGLQILVPENKSENKTFGKGIVLSSIGTESDCFLQVLAKIYKQKADSSLMFANNISIGYANLE